MKAIGAAMGFYLVGLFIFLSIADFSNVNWSNSYYLWDKVKDTIFIVTLYVLLRKYRKVIMYGLLYSIIRVVWEVLSLMTGISVNETIVIRGLFIILAGIFIVVLLKDMIKWRRVK